MLLELTARIFQHRDETNCRGVGDPKGVKTRTTDKRGGAVRFFSKSNGF